MSERVHFKLAFGGETHRFASTLVGDDLFDAVRVKVVSVVGDELVEMYWIDDDSHVVLSSSEDLQTAIDFARFTRTDPAKPPCVLLAVRGAAPQKQPAEAAAAAPAKTESECSRANCTASFPSQGFIDYNAATWCCALCNQQNVVPPSYYEGPQLYFAMSRLETEEVATDYMREQSMIAEEAKKEAAAAAAVAAKQQPQTLLPALAQIHLPSQQILRGPDGTYTARSDAQAWFKPAIAAHIATAEAVADRLRQESKAAEEQAEKAAAAEQSKIWAMQMVMQQLARRNHETAREAHNDYDEDDEEEEREAVEQQHTVQHDGGFSRLPYSDVEEEKSEEESSEEESEDEDELETAIEYSTSEKEEESEVESEEELETAIEYSTSEEEEDSEEESDSEDEEASRFEQAEKQQEDSIKSDEGSWTLEEAPTSPAAAPAAGSIWRRLLPAGPGSMNVPVGLGVAPKGQPQAVPVDVRRELDKSCRLAETSTPEFNAAYNIRQGLSEEEKERLEKESEQAEARARMEFQKRFENSVWTGPAATVQLQPTAQEQLVAREAALAEKETAFERRVATFAVEIEEFEERIRLLEKRVGKVEKDGEMEKRMDEVEERLSKIEM